MIFNCATRVPPCWHYNCDTIFTSNLVLYLHLVLLVFVWNVIVLIDVLWLQSDSLFWLIFSKWNSTVYFFSELVAKQNRMILMFFSEKHYVSVKLWFENGNQFNWLNNNVYNNVIENTTTVYIFPFVQIDFQQKQKTISFVLVDVLIQLRWALKET